MKYHIHKAVVIGSGTMGAAIAAHLANAGVPVTLLDIVPKDANVEDREARNKIVNEGWERCLKAKPANLMSNELKTLVKLGNLEDDFGVVGEADWVCEAIVENLKIKRELMARIDAVRQPNGIVTTNTSGAFLSTLMPLMAATTPVQWPSSSTSRNAKYSSKTTRPSSIRFCSCS